MTRRGFLQVSAGAAALGALGGCNQVAPNLAPEFGAAPARTGPDTYRYLNRLAFGPAANDARALEEQGLATWVQRQLEGAEPEDPRLTLQIRRLDTLAGDAYEVRDTPETEVVEQLQRRALLRATYSRNQLRERLYDFWSDHLNVYARKGLAAYRKAQDEDDVVRRHGLGQFRELLLASARSPAMLMYLDNHQNRRGLPNENYAREILELHSMGVDGGYTQEDVMEVARCFTGWRLEDRFLRHKGAYRFDADSHDDGPKKVLGQVIPAGGGEKDGEVVIDIVAQHPATARHLARKLATYFHGEADPKVTAPIEKAFLTSKGDLRATVEPLFTERLLEGPAILRRPLDYLVACLRATGARTDAGPAVVEQLRAMGQPPYEWPMPDGYPVSADHWRGGMLARWNFAYRLAHGRLGGVRLGDVESRIGVEGEDANALALAMMEPAFQWR
jgi:uncharacterized protein (DUF1800 family)